MSDDDLTAEKLDELERLEAAATPGKWKVVERPEMDDSFVGMSWHAHDAEKGWWEDDSTILTPENAAFIAAIRNAAPALLAAAREAASLRAERDNWQSAHAERCARVDELVAERDALERRAAGWNETARRNQQMAFEYEARATAAEAALAAVTGERDGLRALLAEAVDCLGLSSSLDPQRADWLTRLDAATKKPTDKTGESR